MELKIGCCGDSGKPSFVSGVAWVVHGAIGIAKATLHLDQAAVDVVEQRRAICRACEHAKPCKKTPEKKCSCGKCGCSLKQKTSLRGEWCPENKWAAVK